MKNSSNKTLRERSKEANILPHHGSTLDYLNNHVLTYREAYLVERDHTWLTHRNFWTHPEKVLPATPFMRFDRMMISTAGRDGADDGVNIRTVMRWRKDFRFVHVRDIAPNSLDEGRWITLEKWFSEIWECEECEAHNRLRRAFGLPQLAEPLFITFLTDENIPPLWFDTRLDRENAKNGIVSSR